MITAVEGGPDFITHQQALHQLALAAGRPIPSGTILQLIGLPINIEMNDIDGKLKVSVVRNCTIMTIDDDN